MKLADISRLLAEAKKVIKHTEYVIIGSLSVLGASKSPPEDMIGSIDIDLYPKGDPGRASDVADALGLGSEFEKAHGYYADAVSPFLPTLPDGWEDRMVKVPLENDVSAWFLDINDAAVSKYVRGEARDREWIRAGLREGLISMSYVEYRLRETYMETDERQRAKAAIAEDNEWLAELDARKTTGPHP